MKKVLALFLCAMMLVGLLCGCTNPGEETHEGETGDITEILSTKELASKIHYTSSYDNNGEVSKEEIVLEFRWTADGAVAEGYQLSDEGKSVVRIEAKWDEQNRPASMVRTITQPDGDIHETKVEFSYPSELQIKRVTTNEDGYTYEGLYDYDEKGNLIKETYESYTEYSEYDEHGNCTRNWSEYKDEDMDNWEYKTVYTYDEAGKAVFSVQTRTGSVHESQRHYYYYPNGSLMFTLSVSATGSVNTNFSPYNSKDVISWSYGASEANAGNMEVEKDNNGYITKIVRRFEYGSDEVITLQYDDQGNLVKKSVSDGSEQTWEYDDQNRPVKAVNKSTSGVVTTREYVYDAKGRFVEEKMSSTNGGSETNKRTYNDVGMTTCREEKRVSIYSDGTVISDVKIEVEYIENSNCTVNPLWAEFFLQNFMISI